MITFKEFLTEQDDTPEAIDLIEFVHYYKQGIKRIKYDGSVYTFDYADSMNGGKSVLYSTIGMVNISIDYYGKNACAVVHGDPERTPPFECEVLKPRDFLELYLGNISNKDETIKKILKIYKHVITNAVAGEDFEGGFSDTTTFLSAIIHALHMIGINWPELKAIEKSHYSR
jgi:hypothetical protein